MSTAKKQPAAPETGKGRQKDDNIDDLGRRPDGSEEDQPVNPGSDKTSSSGEKPAPGRR